MLVLRDLINFLRDFFFSIKLTSETVGGTGRLTRQEASKLFHVDLTSLLDTNLEDVSTTLGIRGTASTTFGKINLYKQMGVSL